MMLRIFTLFMLLVTNSFGAEVTFYVVKSPKEMNWSTPRSLFFTTIKNYIRIPPAKTKIGHIYIGYKCDLDESETITGMTSAKGVDLSKALFKGKVGLSVMLTDNPGAVQTTEESLRDINRFKKTKRINALQIHISNEKCLMLKDWHEDYASREEIIYGGIDKRPLLGEGSGCSAFAMSFLEYANIDFDLFNREFLRTVYLPHDLMGGDQGDYKRVRVKNVLRSRTSLKEETENSKRVDFYDPTYIYHWIANEWNAKNQESETSLSSFYDLETKLDRKMKVLVLKEKE